jgi:formylglycine-generating enzyme required for sulfatase activity
LRVQVFRRFPLSFKRECGLVLGSTSACVVAAVAFASGTVLAQSQITPGAPSVPLTPQALANGVQNRITYQYGTEFVTIGAPGNNNWNPPPQFTDSMRGHGGIGYEYRIGRTEITTSQWVAFMNAAYGRSDSIPWISIPSTWGAAADPTYSGPGRRWIAVPGRENYGVGDISWRAAAIYCNWLHNNQSTERSAFLSGAYNVSTFGAFGNIFTDQAAHSPDARFWIPTMGEWMKAAYFDPNKPFVGDPGRDGWWRFPNGTNTAPVYGTPWAGGEANSGFTTATNGLDATEIPLMSYVNAQSPWGVMDLMGGTREWTETIVALASGYRERQICGAAWTAPVDPFTTNRLGFAGGGYPSNEGYVSGFRIAAAIPVPGSAAVLLVGAVFIGRRRR